MLVLQQMNAHYKKLQNVKSSIDMSTPKTLFTNVKTKDRMRQEGVRPSRGRGPNSRPPSARASSRASNPPENFSSNQAYADDPIVDQIVRETMAAEAEAPKEELRLQLDSARPSERSPYASKSAGRRALYDSARSSLRSRPSSAKTAEEAPPDPSGDYLDRHKQYFTDGKRPFQPRLLRSNVPSKLSQFRYYNRPKSAPRKTKDQADGQTPKERRAYDPLDTPQASERMKVNGEAGHEVDLKNGDPYKTRWLVTQEESARRRQKDTSYDGFQHDRTLGSSSAACVHTDTLSGTMQRVQTEEENLKYLQFVSDVTNDVLNRGVYSNKVLNHVFQQHLERNVHGLKTSRMMEAIQSIRDELRIPADDRLDSTFGFQPISHPAGFSSHVETAFKAYPDPHEDAGLTLRHSSDFQERHMADKGIYEVEESDLAIAQVRSDEDDGYEVKDLQNGEDLTLDSSLKPSAAPEDVSPPPGRAEPTALTEETDEEGAEEFQTTQDEMDFAEMRETMASTILRQSTADSNDAGDMPDAAPEKGEYIKNHWSHKVGLDDSNYSEVDNGTLTNTMQSETESANNMMATTLRPGVFDTMLLQTANRPPHPHPRMGRSVTFASQDEVLADTRDSDFDAGTLTEVSAASSTLEMNGLRQSLPEEDTENGKTIAPSASTDYEEDFEDDDGF